jgi:DNA-binding transcriptional LysR family regulator
VLRREDLGDLVNLVAIAEEGSFTRAASKLGMSQSALSHAIKRLEVRLGLKLLTRTTRSVALTTVGDRILEAVRPAFDQVQNRLLAVASETKGPVGTIRITTPEHAAHSILWPTVNRLVAKHPDINVELNVESGLTDIVAERFDAGVRLGEQVAKDMIAVPIGPRLRMAAVAAPRYFETHDIPKTPRNLAQHRCINGRLSSAGGLYAWEFEKNGRELRVRVDGALIFNRVPLILEAATKGHGIAFVIEDQAAPLIADGKLVRILESWCEPFDGYHLYYPSRRQPSSAFDLLVDALRYRKTQRTRDRGK